MKEDNKAKKPEEEAPKPAAETKPAAEPKKVAEPKKEEKPAAAPKKLADAPKAIVASAPVPAVAVGDLKVTPVPSGPHTTVTVVNGNTTTDGITTQP